VAEIPRPSPITHIDNSLWQPGAQSFFHDPRAMHIGDVITVNVSVADTAKMQNTTSRSRTNSDNANLTNLFGLEKVLPPAIDPTSVVKMGSDNSNVGVGSIARAESINMTLAALVAQVLPNGNLVIDNAGRISPANATPIRRVGRYVITGAYQSGPTTWRIEVGGSPWKATDALYDWGIDGLMVDLDAVETASPHYRVVSNTTNTGHSQPSPLSAPALNLWALG